MLWVHLDRSCSETRPPDSVLRILSFNAQGPHTFSAYKAGHILDGDLGG